MKIGILDDELHCVESLVIQINRLFPNATIEYKSNQPHEALEILPDLSIDLLFLDIEMPGISGFELLEQIPNRNFDVIFATAYSQYAIKAFKAKAINYLLKPIDDDELMEAVGEWKKKRSSVEQGNMDKIKSLIDELKQDGTITSKISVPVSDGYEFLNVQDITHCTSDSNYTAIYLKDQGKLVVSKTIKEVEALLNKYHFIRIHRSHIINPNFVTKYIKKDGGYVLMQNNERLPVSNPNKHLMKNLFNSL